MKRITVILCSLALAITGLVALSGCEHRHEFSKAEVITSATCLKAGEEILTCTICGLEKEEIIPALGHDYTEWQTVEEATCMKEGKETRSCKRCDEGDEENKIPRAKHTFSEWVIEEEAACEKSGKRVRTCNFGLHEETVEIPALEHEFLKWEQIVAPTCTQGGEEKSTCIHCGKEKIISVGALEHNFKSRTQLKAPTCTDAGEEELVCERCGFSKTQPILPLDHLFGEWEVLVEPTCAENGEEGEVCSRCGITKTRIIYFLGHIFETWTRVKEPTCTEYGEEKSICTRCGFEDTVPVAMLEHNFGDWMRVKDPTCTEDGREESTCQNCGNKYNRSVERLGHDFGEWKVVSPSTCRKEGEERSYCSRCEKYQTKSLPLSEHSFNAGEREYLREATCIYTGLYHYRCTVCGELGEDLFEPVKEHEYQNGVCKKCFRRDWKTAKIDDPDLYSSDFAFNSFESFEQDCAKMQELYLKIDKAAKEYHSGTSSNDNIGEFSFEGIAADEAVSVWKAYLDDHPLYYWLGREMIYPTQNKYTVPVDSAYTNADERHKINEKIYHLADEWRKQAPENAYLASLAYHDFIIERVDYIERDVIYPDHANWAHNIVGVFEGRGAVCEGYARSFQLLLNMTGIQNIFVTGTSQGGNHAWNLVQLDDGKWYWYDLTFDDNPGWMWGIKYNYFAISENENVAWSDAGWGAGDPRNFSKNHTPDSGSKEHYLGTLPLRAEEPYEGVGEVKLRETFKEGKSEYIVTGFQTVQLSHVETGGTGVVVPEKVSHGELTYTVISLGGMKDGFFGNRIQVFGKDLQSEVGKVTIPSTVKFIWPGTFDGKITSYEVSKDNEYFTAQDGALYTKHMYTLIAMPGASEKFVVPDCVKVLATELFATGNRSLKELKIGKGVELWGTPNWGRGWLDQEPKNMIVNVEGGFWAELRNFHSLEKLEIDPENREIKLEKEGIMSYDGKYYYACLPSTVEAHIPSSVECILYNAFWCRSNLTRIIFEGKNIKRIYEAFGNNGGLEKGGEIVYPGTRAEWDAIQKADKSRIDREIYEKVKITCQGDEN